MLRTVDVVESAELGKMMAKTDDCIVVGISGCRRYPLQCAFSKNAEIKGVTELSLFPLKTEL